MNDLFSDINAQYNAFTKIEKKIADFVLRDAQSVIGMTLPQLAQACEVGNTSIFRFCRDLGEPSFQSFKTRLAQAQALLGDSMTQKKTPMEDGDSPTEIMRKLSEHAVSLLKETSYSVEDQLLTEAARYLANASRICIAGFGSSMVPALEAKLRFMKVTPNTELAFDEHMQLMTSALLTHGDVVLLFSLTGEEKETLDFTATARRRGATIIGVTHCRFSQLRSLCDIVLPVYTYQENTILDEHSARYSQMLLLDTLYMLYVKLRQEK